METDFWGPGSTVKKVTQYNWNTRYGSIKYVPANKMVKLCTDWHMRNSLRPTERETSKHFFESPAPFISGFLAPSDLFSLPQKARSKFWQGISQRSNDIEYCDGMRARIDALVIQSSYTGNFLYF